jgi:hypothetical protein
MTSITIVSKYKTWSGLSKSSIRRQTMKFTHIISDFLHTNILLPGCAKCQVRTDHKEIIFLWEFLHPMNQRWFSKNGGIIFVIKRKSLQDRKNIQR